MSTQARPDRGGSDAPEPTAELIRAARGGDVEGWRKIHDRYRTVLKIVMRGRIPPGVRARFDTDDLLQSGFLVAFRELESYEYRGPGSFRSWLQTIMVSRLHSRLRELHAAKRDPAQERGTASQAELRSMETPSEVVASAERQTELAMALGELDELDRRIVEMKWFDKLSIPRIADELDLHPSKVSRRIVKATQEINARLGIS